MPRFVPVEELFSGRHFDREIVVQCVRWYLDYKLSYRDLVAMMDERGVTLAHTTILRWVQHYSPEFQKRWQRFARTVGGSWRMDETYIRVKGAWMYLYRAADKAGQTVDFFLSRHRDVNAAKAFLRSPPREATLAPDAGAEKLPNGNSGDRWHRIGREDKEGSVQNREARRSED